MQYDIQTDHIILYNLKCSTKFTINNPIGLIILIHPEELSTEFSLLIKNDRVYITFHNTQIVYAHVSFPDDLVSKPGSMP